MPWGRILPGGDGGKRKKAVVELKNVMLAADKRQERETALERWKRQILVSKLKRRP